jgi:hypothetical protein
MQKLTCLEDSTPLRDVIYKPAVLPLRIVSAESRLSKSFRSTRVTIDLVDTAFYKEDDS